jgi:hypothetical protein
MLHHWLFSGQVTVLLAVQVRQTLLSLLTAFDFMESRSVPSFLCLTAAADTAMALEYMPPPAAFGLLLSLPLHMHPRTSMHTSLLLPCPDTCTGGTSGPASWQYYHPLNAKMWQKVQRALPRRARESHGGTNRRLTGGWCKAFGSRHCSRMLHAQLRSACFLLAACFQHWLAR